MKVALRMPDGNLRLPGPPEIRGVGLQLSRAERTARGLGVALLVGRSDDRARPMTGRRRLAALAGLSDHRGFAEYLRCFDWCNLIGKSNDFPIGPARSAACRLKLGLAARGYRWVILLGRGAADAMGVAVPFFEATSCAGTSAVVIPHPSGANRSYNDQATRERAGAVLRWALDMHRSARDAWRRRRGDEETVPRGAAGRPVVQGDGAGTAAGPAVPEVQNPTGKPVPDGGEHCRGERPALGGEG
ncbi:MAG: hypothetical protein ACE5MH_10920, partial [Terriglobia bacterium]